MTPKARTVLWAAGGATVVGLGAYLFVANRRSPQPLSTSASGLAVTTTALAGATDGQSYSYTLSASGGTTPYTWRVTGLPTGLTVNSLAGKISGVPKESGNFPLEVQCQDQSGQSVSVSLTLSVSASSPSTVAVPIQNMGSATEGKPYSYQAQASGGVPPYTWYISGLGGTGLSATSSGLISGTPTIKGTVAITLEVMDSQGDKSTRKTTFTIKAPSTVAPVIPVQSLPTFQVGQAVSYQWQAQGNGPFTWSMEGTIPGISMSSSGLMSGTPTTAQGSPFAIAVTVTDVNGNRATRTTQVYVKAAPPSSTGSSTGTTQSSPPYTAAWTQDCETVLLDAAGNPVSGVSPYAVAPATGGQANFGGYTYSWPACPSYSGSSTSGTGSSTSSEIQSLESQVSSLQAQISSLNAEIASAQSTFSSLHKQNEEYRAEIASLQSQAAAVGGG